MENPNQSGPSAFDAEQAAMAIGYARALADTELLREAMLSLNAHATHTALLRVQDAERFYAVFRVCKGWASNMPREDNAKACIAELNSMCNFARALEGEEGDSWIDRAKKTIQRDRREIERIENFLIGHGYDRGGLAMCVQAVAEDASRAKGLQERLAECDKRLDEVKAICDKAALAEGATVARVRWLAERAKSATALNQQCIEAVQQWHGSDPNTGLLANVVALVSRARPVAPQDAGRYCAKHLGELQDELAKWPGYEPTHELLSNVARVVALVNEMTEAAPAVAPKESANG